MTKLQRAPVRSITFGLAALLGVTASLMTADEIIRADRVAERWRPVRAGLVREQ